MTSSSFPVRFSATCTCWTLSSPTFRSSDLPVFSLVSIITFGDIAQPARNPPGSPHSVTTFAVLRQFSGVTSNNADANCLECIRCWNIQFAYNELSISKKGQRRNKLVIDCIPFSFPLQSLQHCWSQFSSRPARFLEKIKGICTVIGPGKRKLD